VQVPSDFGVEYELSTHQAVSPGIQSGLEHMAQVLAPLAGAWLAG
jgi:hypothetical protein